MSAQNAMQLVNTIVLVMLVVGALAAPAPAPAKEVKEMAATHSGAAAGVVKQASQSAGGREQKIGAWRNPVCDAPVLLHQANCAAHSARHTHSHTLSQLPGHPRVWAHACDSHCPRAPTPTRSAPPHACRHNYVAAQAAWMRTWPHPASHTRLRSCWCPTFSAGRQMRFAAGRISWRRR